MTDLNAYRVEFTAGPQAGGGMKKGKSDSGDDAYRLPDRVCATCGKKTSSSQKGKGGFGEHHWDCACDSQGNLIVRPPTVVSA